MIRDSNVNICSARNQAYPDDVDLLREQERSLEYKHSAEDIDSGKGSAGVPVNINDQTKHDSTLHPYTNLLHPTSGVQVSALPLIPTSGVDTSNSRRPSQPGM
jgi:hypothetical protein